MSSDNAPVGIAGTSCPTVSPSFISEPLPNCFSMLARARSRALYLSTESPNVLFLRWGVAGGDGPGDAVVRLAVGTVRAVRDTSVAGAPGPVENRPNAT